MSLMVSIARVSHVPEGAALAEFHRAHRVAFGEFCSDATILRDPGDPNQIALVADVRDLDGLRAASRTPEGDEMMRKYGFLEQMSYFLEEA